jgi:predicted ATPase/DNA-binding winged helix-turn-helix (wHTH) protein
VSVSDQAQNQAELAISFGPFRLIAAQQLLLDADRPVRIGSRALEILIHLVERAGEVVGKDEIVARVWPKTFVEDANLRVHIAALRKALGDGEASARYIVTVPGRGYSFVAPVARLEEQAAPVPPATEAAADHNLPAQLTRMLGRTEIVTGLAEQLPERRFLTILGPGGIGKTTVALAVAHRLVGSYADGIRFIDLSPLSDDRLVPSAIAFALGLAVHSDNPIPALTNFLKGKHMLLVLDSCEHVIEAAATLAEEVLKAASGVHILATSREPLRAEGEHVHRLSPLAVPAASEELSAAEALASPAVRLFVERAAARAGDFALSDAEAPLVANICRTLDGMALAIEIAASRVDAFGVAGLEARLNDRFRLLMQGRRTALPRHRTLSAALDWSYAQLPEFERLVLRRLAAFAGVFTMESAGAVVSDADTSFAEVVDAIANLFDKSLVSADVHGAIAFYRLLDTTRAYALVKLEEVGERDRLARRHAEHYRILLEQAQAEWETRPATEWLERHRHLIDNVRAALDWAFSPSGDTATGVALTVAAIPLWFALSLTSECAERIDRALGAPAASRDAGREMRLYTARAWSLMQTKGSVPETQAAWTQVLEISERQGDVDHQLQALWGLWSGLLNRCEFRPALALAERFSELAASHTNPANRLVGDRMVGYILHLMGDQAQAREYIERMLAGYDPPVIGAEIIRFVFDQRATAQCFLARILWLQGHADSALRLTRGIVEGALAGKDVLSLCQVLVQAACPVEFFVGDLAAVDRYVKMLLGHSERQALDFWQTYGRCFQAVLFIKRGQVAEGLDAMKGALEELREIQFGVYYGVFLSEYADALGHVGRTAEGLMAIDEALARSERSDERWYLAELLRIKGELILREGADSAPAEAERHFQQALDCARLQGALSWELRAAASLAKLLHSQKRSVEAHDCLAPVYAKFREGFGTADLAQANALLTELAPQRKRRRESS